MNNADIVYISQNLNLSAVLQLVILKFKGASWDDINHDCIFLNCSDLK